MRLARLGLILRSRTFRCTGVDAAGAVMIRKRVSRAKVLEYFGEVGMLIYSAWVTLYLAYLGFTSILTGVLLWWVVALHVILTVFLARAFMRRET
jgi:hypothetical protein